MNLLAVLEQNRGADWRALLGQVEIAADPEAAAAPVDDAVAGDREAPRGEDDDDLSTFRL